MVSKESVEYFKGILIVGGGITIVLPQEVKVPLV